MFIESLDINKFQIKLSTKSKEICVWSIYEPPRIEVCLWKLLYFLPLFLKCIIILLFLELTKKSKNSISVITLTSIKKMILYSTPHTNYYILYLQNHPSTGSDINMAYLLMFHKRSFLCITTTVTYCYFQCCITTLTHLQSWNCRGQQRFNIETCRWSGESIAIIISM